jgi:oligopeptide/dipeptide ABC transporter ATP-binding protein
VTLRIAAETQGLTVEANGADSQTTLVDDLSLSVYRREVVGLVGETGAGKTLTARALLGLLPRGVRAHGRARIVDEAWTDLADTSALRRLLGHETGLVTQNPAGMLDPLRRLGSQLVEGVVRLGVLPKESALERARGLLAAMGFAEPDEVMRLYPHELSGGMSQRAAIAMAMMPHPALLVVDEPTSALDAIIRVEVLQLLREAAQTRDSAVLMVSHDLGLVSHFCDRIAVMYAGRIVESGRTAELLARPEHPYTTALLRCSAALDAQPRVPLAVIPDTPPRPGHWPTGCVFQPRCPVAFDKCSQRPAPRRVGARLSACHRAFQAADGR